MSYDVIESDKSDGNATESGIPHQSTYEKSKKTAAHFKASCFTNLFMCSYDDLYLIKLDKQTNHNVQNLVVDMFRIWNQKVGSPYGSYSLWL